MYKKTLSIVGLYKSESRCYMIVFVFEFKSSNTQPQILKFFMNFKYLEKQQY